MPSLNQYIWRKWYSYQSALNKKTESKIIATNSKKIITGFDGALIEHSILESTQDYYQLGKKLLGLYEYEVKNYIMNTLKGIAFEYFVSLGASDGIEAYRYAQILQPQKIVLADTETDRYQKKWIKMFNSNNLTCLGHIHSLNQVECLNQTGVGRKLVLIDVEGCEVALLRQGQAIPNADLIVEYHTSDICNISELFASFGYRVCGFIPIVPQFYLKNEILDWACNKVCNVSTKEMIRLLFETRTYSVCWIHISSVNE